MNEDKLVGWLIMWSLEGNTAMPGPVRRALHDKGWLEVVDPDLIADDDHESQWAAFITDAGSKVIDLEGPAWGIDTLKVRPRGEG